MVTPYYGILTTKNVKAIITGSTIPTYCLEGIWYNSSQSVELDVYLDGCTPEQYVQSLHLTDGQHISTDVDTGMITIKPMGCGPNLYLNVHTDIRDIPWRGLHHDVIILLGYRENRIMSGIVLDKQPKQMTGDVCVAITDPYLLREIYSNTYNSQDKISIDDIGIRYATNSESVFLNMGNTIETNINTIINRLNALAQKCIDANVANFLRIIRINRDTGEPQDAKWRELMTSNSINSKMWSDLPSLVIGGSNADLIAVNIVQIARDYNLQVKAEVFTVPGNKDIKLKIITPKVSPENVSDVIGDANVTYGGQVNHTDNFSIILRVRQGQETINTMNYIYQ